MVMQFLWYLLGVLSLESRCIRSPTTLRPVCCQGAKPHGKTMCPGSCGSSILGQARHTADTSEHMSARLQPSDIQFCLRIHVFPAESQTLLSGGQPAIRLAESMCCLRSLLFWQHWALDLGPHACEVSTLPWSYASI